VDFALILFVLSIATGCLWFYDVLVTRKRRAKGSKDPWWVEYGASFFPVILPIFLLRSFWLEPFRIPSESMVPTLLVGDFILVNKYAYGIRLPVLNKKLVDIDQPKRGDVMVFRYPLDPSQNYIKRVVGLPGDRIEYLHKKLIINGQTIASEPREQYRHPEKQYLSDRYAETLDGAPHSILNDKDTPSFVPDIQRAPHPYAGNCTHSLEGVVCQVPPGHYFVMGDNRDQSADSRFWGFVPDQNVVGRAFFIWFHADAIVPPKGIQFDRLGHFK
jgi:signal peptidase I